MTTVSQSQVAFGVLPLGPGGGLLARALMACAFLLVAACGQSCGGDALDQFGCAFENAVDELIDEMQHSRGTTTGSFTGAPSGKTLKFKYAKIHHVGKKAIEVGEQFESVPAALYVQWASLGLTDDEEQRLRSIMTQQQQKYRKALDRLKSDIREHPELYRAPISANDPFSGFRNYSYSWGDNGELHIQDSAMLNNQSRYVIMDNLLNYDVDVMIQTIRDAYDAQKASGEEAGGPSN